jgi:hypothetical protein
MDSFYVIGCNSLQLSADGIKVFRESGVMTIAWSDVKLASIGGVNDHSQRMQLMTMVMGGQLGSVLDMMRTASQSQETIFHGGPGTTPQKYDVLWIAHRGGAVLVYIEPGGAERDQLLTGLRTRLGPLWLGEGAGSGMARHGALDYVVAAPAGRVNERKSGCALRILGWVAAAVCVLFFGSLFFFGSLNILRAANRGLVDFFSAGGWKPAIFLGALCSLVALIYWVRKNSA